MKKLKNAQNKITKKDVVSSEHVFQGRKIRALNLKKTSGLKKAVLSLLTHVKIK